MNWLNAFPTILVAVGVLLIPGYALAWASGLRSHWRLGLAAPLTMSGIGMASFVLERLGIAWSPVSAGGFIAALGLLLILLFRVILRRGVLSASDKPPTRQTIALGVGLCLGSLLLAYRIAQGIGDPENISQTFDNVFHLNALRFVLDTASASPMTIGEVNAPGAAGFYPSGWHALTSLVVMISGATLPTAVSAVSIAVGSVVVALSFSLLVRQFVGSRITVLLAFGVTVAAFPSFPLLLLFFGVLYPLFLGVALVPAALALLANNLGFKDDAPATGLSRAGGLVMLLGLTPGIMLAHPGAFLAGLAASVPMVLVWGARRWRGSPTKTKVSTGLTVGAFLVGGICIYWLARPPMSHAVWRATMQIQDGIVEAITLTMRGASVSLALIFFVVIGAVVAVRRRTPADLALLGMYVVFVMLYAVAAGMDNLPVRYALVGPWYSDIPRLAAFVPIAAIPLATLGLGTSLDWVNELVSKRISQSTRLLYPVSAGVLLLAIIGTQGTSMLAMATQMRSAYTSDDTSKLVSADERELLERLANEVPEDATIAGSSWTGAGMAYALAGRPVLMTHTFMAEDADLELINDKLRSATPGSEVCRVMDKRNVQFVLDFGELEVHGGRHEFAGLEDLEDSDAVQLVDQEGEAKLYKVVGCG